MKNKLFGTDGIRGLANGPTLTPELALRVGAALTVRARGRDTRPVIAIGRDTRASGVMLENALSAGVCALGGDAVLCGVLPTPAIAMLGAELGADAAVVISASHNPFEDNGIKIFGRDGYKLPDEDELAIEAMIGMDLLDRERPHGRAIGRTREAAHAEVRYLHSLLFSLGSEFSLRGVRIVLDAAHGAAHRVGPELLQGLGADVIPLGVSPDGYNINDACGATRPEACAAAVRAHGAQLGICLDGDADRLIMVDERGRVVDGDALMALCARHMLSRDPSAPRGVVATVMSNLGLERAVREAGGYVVRCPVGDRHVVETLRRESLRFGGEQSGHLVFLDAGRTGDGLLAALRVLTIVRHEERALGELADAAMTRVPQLLRNVRLGRRRPLEELPRTRRLIDACAHTLGDAGRVLVRWSGTEPLLRIMVEGPDEAALSAWADDIAHAATSELSPQPDWAAQPVSP